MSDDFEWFDPPEFGDNSLDYWRLSDELNIIQAALLVVGIDPGPEQEYVEQWESHKRPPGYEAAKSAISFGLKNGDIEGNLVPEYDYDINGNNVGAIDGSIDIKMSSVSVSSLKQFLGKRGISKGFFFPDTEELPDYLDSTHPRYAPKLAAAINAWLAMDNASLFKGKSAKQAIDKWIREHAAEYELTDDEGNPVNQAVEDCSKVANWQTSGGAPKSPSD